MADSKVFAYEGCKIIVESPKVLRFENDFYQELYTFLFDKIERSKITPHIDFDALPTSILWELAEKYEIAIKIEKKHLADDSIKNIKAMQTFLEVYPVFYNFLCNLNASADITIQSTEILHGEKVNAGNFIHLKKTIDDWNRLRWTRTRILSERQSGVSNLGTISEKLLESALTEYIDKENFFKNNSSSVQSYGDFVLMCLPNNLWLSVKSNFARERLLASGFTTDIIGVGFFTDSTEFTSGAKIRNFQKVGFLAMYLPDISITEEQTSERSSTYFEVVRYYEQHKTQHFPLNINGKPFVRKLSDLKNDIDALLQVKDIKKRVTIGF